MNLETLAIFHCSKTSSLEAARQGSDDSSAELGEIRFTEGFEKAALDDLEGFSHLWIIFGFHKNTNWNAKVLPPRGSDKKIGVFATRSPYRPNPIGISCVRLVKKEGLSLFVSQYDLLDQTPIYDIKPYLPYADSFPEAKIGWLEGIELERCQVLFTELAQTQLKYLEILTEFKSTIIDQLSFEPLNQKKKRVRKLSDSRAVFSYKTWRVEFSVDKNQIEVQKIYSGYSEEELKAPADPYQDKDLHRSFNQKFN